MNATLTVTAQPPSVRVQTDLLREFSPLLTEERLTVTVDPPEARQAPGVTELQARLGAGLSALASALAYDQVPFASVTLSVVLEVPSVEGPC